MRNLMKSLSQLNPFGASPEAGSGWRLSVPEYMLGYLLESLSFFFFFKNVTSAFILGTLVRYPVPVCSL